MNDPTPSSAEESRIQDYLAGRLDEAAADRFEQRLFEDDALAAEVQRALEIRAAMSPAGAERRTARPRPRWLFALAAAAAAAMVAVGVLWLQPLQPPVFRGVEQRMGLEIEVDGNALFARWQPIGGAAGYELQLLARDGSMLLTLNVDDAEARILLSPVDGLAPAFVEVSALDDVGQTLRRSERLALPDR